MGNFFDYLETLPPNEKKALRKRIVKACFIEQSTWYSWMQRHNIPRPAQKLIALELGQPMEELFPETNQ